MENTISSLVSMTAMAVLFHNIPVALEYLLCV
jgi:hypothetical protein